MNLRTLIPLAALLACLATAGPAAGSVGQLSYDGCHGDSDAHGCVDLPDSPFGGTGDVAVSPDGRSDYVAGLV